MSCLILAQGRCSVNFKQPHRSGAARPTLQPPPVLHHHGSGSMPQSELARPNDNHSGVQPALPRTQRAYRTQLQQIIVCSPEKNTLRAH